MSVLRLSPSLTSTFQKQLSLIRQKSFLREERRKEVLERKKSTCELTGETDEVIDQRKIHTDDEVLLQQ